MDEILQGLLTTLRPVADAYSGQGLTVSLQVADAHELAVQITKAAGAMFTLFITPLGHTSRSGPFGDTLTREFQTVVRIVAHSSNRESLRLPEYSDNLYKLADAVRAALAGSKGLSISDSWAPYALSPQQPLRETVSTRYVALEITLTHTRLEDWSGARNNQTGLTTPAVPAGG